MKTPAEIEVLKKSWTSDPIWDLEDSEGFEEHKKELKEYSDRWKAIWLLQAEMKKATKKLKRSRNKAERKEHRLQRRLDAIQ